MTKLAKLSCEAFIYGVIPDPFLNLRSCKMEKMKGIDALKKIKYLAGIFLFMLVRDIWRKPLIESTKSAKILCKAFSYCVTSDPFLDLSSSKIEQMKGIDDLKNKYFVLWGPLLKVGRGTDPAEGGGG